MLQRLRLRHIKHVSTKLLLVLLVCLVCVSAVLGYINIRLHRRDLEGISLDQAIAISDFVRDNTYRSMMANDRQGLHDAIDGIGHHIGIERIRIVDHDGRVAFSSDAHEAGSLIRRDSSQCTDCHRGNAPPTLQKRFRIYETHDAGGRRRVLGVIAPIVNRPECSNAACHAHPPSQRVLGVLDTGVSLKQMDASLASSSLWIVGLLFGGTVLIAVLLGLSIRHVLHTPLQRLHDGTQHLGQGELGYQIPVESADELGALADAFNSMSSQLQAAQREITAWTHTLEHRVEQKTRELQNTHQQMLRVERMVAIGKMSAVVAHEINNPLAGILTYAKLIRKWIARGIQSEEQRHDAIESLDLIATESKRCGELLQNLLSFSRTSPMNLSLSELNGIVSRTIRLAEHKAEIGAVALQLDLDPALPPLQCDAAQIEQVALALVINAIDAMPHGGNLWVSTRALPGDRIELQVRDDGVGIPPEILPRIFDPFTTTKEVGKGVGLGLAVSKQIVDRHGGHIEVSSELGVGTTFRVILPLRAVQSPVAEHQEPRPTAACSAMAGEQR
jgi:two-component system, NtrC family, sensor kinase